MEAAAKADRQDEPMPLSSEAAAAPIPAASKLSATATKRAAKKKAATVDVEVMATMSIDVPTDDCTKKRKLNSKKGAPVLVGRRMLDSGDVREALEALETQWSTSFVSCTHFIQLDHPPSQDCLWAMLARRAAGILPRGHRGADLVILVVYYPAKAESESDDAKPTVPHEEGAGGAGPQVSMVLIQVKNREDADASFPGSAIFGTRPEYVFSKDKVDEVPLHAMSPETVLRIHMSLRGRVKADRFYVCDDHYDCVHGVGKKSYVLCIQNVDEWVTARITTLPADASEVTTTSTVPELPAGSATTVLRNTTPPVHVVTVVSKEVSDQLNDLLSLWWSVRQLATTDVADRTEDENVLGVQGVPESKLLEVATTPLGPTLVFNRKSEKIPAVPSSTA